MKILGIETSCDETAVALVEDGRIILRNTVASSATFFRKYGGVVPEIAARKQIEYMPSVLYESLRGYQTTDIDAIAVTLGPGLIGSLLIGIETARTLAFAWNKPIIPINHLVGHLYAAWLFSKRENFSTSPLPAFPLLGLVVSGGHTDLVLMQGHNSLVHLGSTRDDAAGEAFDKIARMLDLPYPGGLELSELAQLFRKSKTESQIQFPFPMIHSNDYDFSFSGLKTAVFNFLRSKQKTAQLKQNIAYEVEEVICTILSTKLLKAVEEFQPKTIVIGGGVAANSRLRLLIQQSFKKRYPNIQVVFPQKELCTDNATYIAARAFYSPQKIDYHLIRPQPSLTIADKIGNLS